MQKRNPIAVVIFSLITLGIYSIYWMVKTKGEMNAKGAQIPTAWLIIVPFVNIWWLWKYSEGVDLVTNRQLTTVISFILLLVLDLIGLGIVQYYFNEQSAPTIPDAPLPPAPEETPTPPAAPQA